MVTPKRVVYFMGNPTLKWMMTVGTPPFQGNPHCAGLAELSRASEAMMMSQDMALEIRCPRLELTRLLRQPEISQKSETLGL